MFNRPCTRPGAPGASSLPHTRLQEPYPWAVPHHVGRPSKMWARMTRDPKALDPSEVRAINDQASVLMKQGIRRLDDGDQAAIVEALSCFDRALDMRRGLPIDNDPVLRYGLAACLLNRGDALVRLGDAGRMVDAL